MSNPYEKALAAIEKKKNQSQGGSSESKVATEFDRPARKERPDRPGLRSRGDKEGIFSLKERPSDRGNAPIGWDDNLEVANTDSGTGGGGALNRDLQPPRKFENIKEEKFAWHVVHKANLYLKPNCPRPAIRSCGFFRTEAEADGWVKKHLEHPSVGGMGLQITKEKCKHVCMCGINKKRCESLPTIELKKKQILDSHYAWAEERKKMFDKNVNAKKHGEVGLTQKRKRWLRQKQTALRKEYPRPEVKEEDEVKESGEETAVTASNEVPPLPLELRVPGQESFSVTVIPDCSVTATDWEEAEAVGREPIYIPHSCDVSSDQLDKITENAVWKAFQDADTLTGPMYEWLFLDQDAIDDPAINNNWLNSEQDLIMKRQEQDIKDAQAFAEICQSMNKKVPIIDLTDKDGTGMVPAMHKGKLTDAEIAENERVEKEQQELEDKINNGTEEEKAEALRQIEQKNKPKMIDADGVFRDDK